MQVSQAIPFRDEGSQDAAEGGVHCRGWGSGWQARRSDPSSSPKLFTPLLATTLPVLTLLGQGPETTLQVGVVWRGQSTGARRVPRLQVAGQVGNRAMETTNLLVNRKGEGPSSL